MNSKTKHNLLLNAGIALVAIFLMSGCDLDESSGRRDIKFNLREHVEEREMDCVDCHPGVETEDSPGWPDMEKMCLACHNKIDKNLKGKDSPYSEKCLYCHNPQTDLPLKEQKVVLGLRKSKDLIMPHGKHIQADVECSDCHGEIAKMESFFSCGDIKPQAEVCQSCHAKKNISSDCSTCHKAAKRLKPKAHQANWLKRHGMEAEFAESGGHGRDCSTCHSKRECAECHTQTTPKNHTNFWRTRGHGIESRMNRESCLVCHKQNSCVECHRETSPSNHRGAWLANHCRACHLQSSFIPENNRCAVCHRQIPHVVP